MKIFSFLSAFSSAFAAAGAFASSVAYSATTSIRHLGDFFVSLVVSAFPPREIDTGWISVAAAPRVTGLARVRSFRRRILERPRDSFSRYALSQVIVGT